MPIAPNLLAAVMSLVSVAISSAPQTPADAAQPGVRRAMILVGLPGDEEHAQRFAAIVDVWRSWLTENLEVSPQNILTLQDREGNESATKENVSRRLKELLAKLESGDALWVLVLGHADEHGRRARLHLPGPDINDMEFAELFAGVECREQVFWLTHTCSSHFLRLLSRKSRIVITATAPDEGQNETEFPEALADVVRQNGQELDRDQDGDVSLAELFLAVAYEVESRFAADQRVATEHAQLDDDGDGRGTEAEELLFTAPANDTPKSLRRDGSLATQVHLSWKTSQEPSRTEND